MPIEGLEPEEISDDDEPASAAAAKAAAERAEAETKPSAGAKPKGYPELVNLIAVELLALEGHGIAQKGAEVCARATRSCEATQSRCAGSALCRWTPCEATRPV